MKKLFGLLLLLGCASAWGQVPISALPAASALAGNEPIPVVQSSATKRSSPIALQQFLEGQVNIWTGATNTFTGSLRAQGGIYSGVTTSTAQIIAGNDIAGLYLVDAQQAIDNRFWAEDVSGTNFGILAVNDADTSSKAAFIASRSGLAISNITLGNLTDKPSITADGPVSIASPVSGPALSAAGDILSTTGSLRAQAGVFPGIGTSTAEILAGSDFAGLYLIDAQQAADNRFWAADTAGGNFAILAVNDASSISRVAFQAGRSGVSISSITLGNLTDKPPITLDGAVSVATPVSGPAISAAGDIVSTTGSVSATTGSVFARGGTFPGIANSEAQILGGTDFAGLYLIDAQQAVDNRFWAEDVSGTNFGIFAVNDASSISKLAFQASRLNTAITSVTLGNLTDKPPINLDGPTSIPAGTGSNVPLTINEASTNNAGINLLANGNFASLLNVINSGTGTATEAGMLLSDGITNGFMLYQAASYSGAFGSGPSLLLGTNSSSSPVILSPNSTLGLSVNATTGVLIPAIGSGTALQAKLNMTDSGSSAGLFYQGSTFSNGILGTGRSLALVTSTTSDPIQFVPNNVQEMQVTTNGTFINAPTSGTNPALQVTATAGASALNVIGSFLNPGTPAIAASGASAASPSYGFAGQQEGMYSTGNNKLDFSTSGVDRMQIGTTGNLSAYGQGPAALIDISPDTGTGTIQCTAGMTTTPSVTAKFWRVGPMAFMEIPPLTGTGNTVNTLTYTISYPTGFAPTISKIYPVAVANAGVGITGLFLMSSTGATLVTSPAGTNWTGTVGNNVSIVIAYPID